MLISDLSSPLIAISFPTPAEKKRRIGHYIFFSYPQYSLSSCFSPVRRTHCKKIFRGASLEILEIFCKNLKNSFLSKALNN